MTGFRLARTPELRRALISGFCPPPHRPRSRQCDLARLVGVDLPAVLRQKEVPGDFTLRGDDIQVIISISFGVDLRIGRLRQECPCRTGSGFCRHRKDHAPEHLVVLGLGIPLSFRVGCGGVAFCFGAGFRELGSRLLILPRSDRPKPSETGVGVLGVLTKLS